MLEGSGGQRGNCQQTAGSCPCGQRDVKFCAVHLRTDDERTHGRREKKNSLQPGWRERGLLWRFYRVSVAVVGSYSEMRRTVSASGAGRISSTVSISAARSAGTSRKPQSAPGDRPHVCRVAQYTAANSPSRPITPAARTRDFTWRSAPQLRFDFRSVPLRPAGTTAPHHYCTVATPCPRCLPSSSYPPNYNPCTT